MPASKPPRLTPHRVPEGDGESWPAWAEACRPRSSLVRNVRVRGAPTFQKRVPEHEAAWRRSACLAVACGGHRARGRGAPLSRILCGARPHPSVGSGHQVAAPRSSHLL